MSKEFWKRLILVVVIGLLFVFAWTFFNQIGEIEFKEKKIKVSDIELTVEVADNQDSRKIGLQGRETLGDNRGMLLVFEEKDFHSVWMKGMKFAIDILWINDNQVVYIEEFVPPDRGKKSYRPPVQVDQVLELQSGWVEENNVGVGSTVEI